MPKTLSFEDFAHPERLATQISLKYAEWEMFRSGWLSLGHEAREYVFATDTRGTSAGAKTSWKNSTHIPKLCQIRDNLHANYIAAIFPNDRSISWEGADQESDTKDKREAVEAYMREKLKQTDFMSEASKTIYDFIDHGNCFGIEEFVNESHQDPITLETIQGYVGPRMRRISPLDIVFDCTAPSFGEAPKIIRSVVTIADIAKTIRQHPERGYMQEVLDKVVDLRHQHSTGMSSASNVEKNSAFLADGFSSWDMYFESDYVEILEYYGDLYDKETDEFMSNQHIVVVDRAYIIKQETHASWLGHAPIYHAGWRTRPDNLYAMGPLDNLVGLQYRLDHLENAKADALDLILHPVFKIRGMVEDFKYGPNERIYVGDDGDVEFMTPDASALSANTEIAQILTLMEEMAGAPRQAMGLRTPGEKTKFEVQVLENGANRVFLNKTSQFEMTFLEPLLNSMLETARRNFTASQQVRIEDLNFRFVNFLNITKEDLTAKGKLRAIGARRFARKANVLQDLTTFSNTPLAQDPAVAVHFSGIKLARALEDLLELSDYGIVQENVRVMEQAETQQVMNAASEQIIEEQTRNMSPEQIQEATQQQQKGGPEQ